MTTHSATVPMTARRRTVKLAPLLRAAVPVTAGLAACAILLGLAWQAGGYFPDATLKAGAAAFAVLAVLVAVRPPRWSLSSPALLALSCLAALAGWTALSATWSAMPDVAIEDFQRALTYVGLLGLGLVAAGSGRHSRLVVWAALAVALTILCAGLASRLHPGWFGAGAQPDALADYRLAYPLAYWNAFGALGAMTVVLATGLAGDPRSAPALRGLAAGGAVLAGTAAYLSFSRGAWLAFFVGVAVLALMAAHRLHLLTAVAIAGLALAAVLLRLRGLPGLTDGPHAGAGQVADGRAFQPTLLWVALAAAVAQFLAARLWPPQHVRDRALFLGRRAAPYLAGGVVVLGGLGYAVAADRVEGHAAAGLDRARDWVSRQWDEFMRPEAFSASGAQRLSSSRGTRSDLYRVAIDGLQAHPLRGDGSGSYQVRFAHDRRVAEKVRDAHSLGLETLSELGLVGGALLLGLLGAIVWGALVARRTARALGRSQAAACSAAVAVWIAHAMVDWDWQVPALTGIALLLAAAMLPVGRSGRRHSRRRIEAAD